MNENKVNILGIVTSKLQYSHEIKGEVFYKVYIKISRTSGNFDIIPVIFSESVVDVTKDYIGFFAEITGKLHSYKNKENGKKNIELYVLAKEIFFFKKGVSKNNIYINGYIFKKPIYRKTPLGREITDCLILLNRPYGRTDNIPCICWGVNAELVSKFEVGDNVEIFGRIQSREYIKNVGNGMQECKMLHEVSVRKINVVGGKEK